MKIRELIQKLEGEKNALQEENKVLREKVDKLSIEIYLLKGKLDSKEKSESEEQPKVDVNKESKPKRSRKKKVEETPIFVEPVEEPENA